MIAIDSLIAAFPPLISTEGKAPWQVIADLSNIIEKIIPQLDENYLVNEGIAIHRTAVMEAGVICKPPVIIGPGCFVAAHAYLRGAVYLANEVTIGPGCEIKTSILCHHSAVAHFNFIGDSIIGSHVNMEAGSLIANHYNERIDKTILVLFRGSITDTGVTKFGALVADHCKIGANAVLSPGTILEKATVVKRLQLIEQVKIETS